ncbi:hypothetical protein ITP53_43140 [Nonomuraea sp. K274]|uniref:Uncharacterized protein n=1 Tax=Nonomuraea cypriaca TaxID=1187855 RepID=A0A931F5R9_9ACTN|nr:hypothetical protein [Nonomuraea cypriaca]MBF8192366.1 hypothetical protein [Nonomuraea cypriaca]
MRKVLAATALTASIAFTGLAVAPAAQAATAGTATQATSIGNWGKYYSSNHKAYTFGKTWRLNGKVYTKWYGKEFSPKRGYVWFKYYSGGSWHKFSRDWNNSYSEIWSKSSITKLYTYTCWGGKFTFCGAAHRIY